MDHKLAITHASGIAAEAVLEKLASIGIPAESLVLLDDESRMGAKLPYADTYLGSSNQHDYNFRDCNLLLLMQADEEIERAALAQGCFLISHAISTETAAVYLHDQQSLDIAFNDSSLRLVSPELGCLLPVLCELDREYAIAQLNLTLMRSAEFYGKVAVDELATQTVNLLNGKEAKNSVYPQQIAFNVISSASDFSLTRDLSHFLGNSSCSLSQQSVNVPLFHGFAAGVQIRFEAEVKPGACKRLMTAIDKVDVRNAAISPISDCNQSFSCVISHIEQTPNQASSLQFWLMADPMRYGLANNYAKVADFLLKSFL